MAMLNNQRVNGPNCRRIWPISPVTLSSSSTTLATGPKSRLKRAATLAGTTVHKVMGYLSFISMGFKAEISDIMGIWNITQ